MFSVRWDPFKKVLQSDRNLLGGAQVVAANGTLTYDNKRIGVGVRWAGRRVRVVRAGELTHVFYGELLIRSLKIDPTRRYQHRPDPDYIGRRPRP